MTGALLSVALAALLWPGRRGFLRKRLATVVGRGRAPRVLSGSGVDPALVAAAVVGATGAVVSTLLVTGLGAVAAFVLTRSWQARRAEKRSDSEVRDLTDRLAALAAELRSGRSLSAASEAAAAPAGVEMGRALASAVRSPRADRSQHRDAAVRAALDRVAAGATLSVRTGCSLATVLTAVEDDLRARARNRQELRAATSGPRAGAAVLAGLPVLGLAMGSGVGADPWRVLTTTLAGQVLLVVGVCLELAGLEWSRRLVERALR